MLLIIKIKKYYQTLKNTDTSTLSDEDKKILDAKIAAIQQINQYIQCGNWCNTATRQKFIDFLKNKCDYSATALQYNCSVPSLRTQIWRCDNYLRRKIQPAFELIVMGDVNEGIVFLKRISGDCDYKAMYGVSLSEIMPHPSNIDKMYCLSDCTREISFLRNNNSYSLKNQLNQLNEDKMRYLIFLLNTDNTSNTRLITQQTDLINRLLS